MNDNRTSITIGGGGTWIICAILAIALLWYNCSTGVATGYVSGICQNGLGIWDFLGLICCAPVYLLFLLLGGASLGVRFW